MNQIGKAILYYEKALKLDPGDDDIEANLSTANLATVDKITPPEEFAFSRLLVSLLFFLPGNFLLNTVLALYYLIVLAAVLSILRIGRYASLMRTTAMVLSSAAIVCLVLFGLQWIYRADRVEAVVMAEEVTVLSEPGQEATAVFTLHEGSKVRIGQRSEDWAEIVLIDGKVGWVKANLLETI
jgi:hypothetical protein